MFLNCSKTKVFFERIFDLPKQLDFVYNFTSLKKLEDETLETIHSFTKSVIKARRGEIAKETKNNDEKVNDENDFGIKKKIAFMDLLLTSTIDGKPLSDLDVQEEVDTLMFGVSEKKSFHR